MRGVESAKVARISLSLLPDDGCISLAHGDVVRRALNVHAPCGKACGQKNTQQSEQGRVQVAPAARAPPHRHHGTQHAVIDPKEREERTRTRGRREKSMCVLKITGWKALEWLFTTVPKLKIISHFYTRIPSKKNTARSEKNELRI